MRTGSGVGRVFLIGLLLMILNGCLGLDPSPDPTRYYTLAPTITSGDPVVNLRVRVTELPYYLQTKRIALRKGDFEVSYRHYERWTGPLEEMLERRIAGRLRASASAHLEGSVVLLRIRHLEGTTSGQVRLVADWDIRIAEDLAPAFQGGFAEVRAWPEPFRADELVSIQGALLDALAESILASASSSTAADSS